jgi:hypothetical protein
MEMKHSSSRPLRLHVLLLLAISVIFVIFMLTMEAYAQSRWYAGYYYAGYEIYAPWGVGGRIITIDTSLPSSGSAVAWHVTVVLSYRNGYWIQLGYEESNNYPFFHYHSNPLYYWECVSMLGTYVHQNLQTGPAAGSWHIYQIFYAQSSQYPKRWVLSIDFGSYQRTCDVEPYEPKDLQALVEVVGSSRIIIDGGHFKDLSRYDGHSWPLWDRHVAYWDSPYQVIPVLRNDCLYNCEFKVSGGG